MKAIILAIGMIFPAAAADQAKIAPATPADGVYVTYGDHSIVLELKGGKFRYWFSSDAKIAGDELKYPLAGTYSTDGDKIVLKHEKITAPQGEWTARQVDGVLTLWRSDALKIHKEGKLDLYIAGKANFLRAGAGMVLVPTTKTADQAWAPPEVRTLTEEEFKAIQERLRKNPGKD